MVLTGAVGRWQVIVELLEELVFEKVRTKQIFFLFTDVNTELVLMQVVVSHHGGPAAGTDPAAAASQWS